MEDIQIVDLYWMRSEDAIPQTAAKYGALCRYIADRILHDDRDSEECVNDTYLHAWKSMPPKRPDILSAFLAKITRNLALDRYEKDQAKKRGGGECPLVLDELEECIPGPDAPDKVSDSLVIRYTLNRFLSKLPADKRKIFVLRYWYLEPVKEIAKKCKVSESNVKMTLQRLREELKQLLAEGGIYA